MLLHQDLDVEVIVVGINFRIEDVEVVSVDETDELYEWSVSLTMSS